MPILLDFFSGSLSWSKAFAELPDWECISVDNDAKFTDTTIVCDVLEWEVPERLHGAVDVVTIGVPCTAYSTANKKKSEEAQEATRVLWRRAFEIADLVLKPNGVFVAENPSRTELTGCKSRPIGDMEALIRPGLYKTEVNYCRYSTPPEYVFSWKKTTLMVQYRLATKWFRAPDLHGTRTAVLRRPNRPKNWIVRSFQSHGIHELWIRQNESAIMGDNAPHVMQRRS